MAVTKIHPIKSTLKKALDYIENPAKTDEKMLVSSFACSYETADIEFELLLSQAMQKGNNLAHHLIQSFAPGETTPEQAHEIGQQLADEVLQGKYPYVLTTHIDKGHVHNHVIFCAVDMVNQRKYVSNRQSYAYIRRTSDRLCKEHGLSVVMPGQDRGKSYAEWDAHRKGTSWKAKLKTAIDAAIPHAKDFDDFLRLLQEQGYEVKRGKYVSFRAPGQGRFTRCKTLGEAYTEEAITERIKGRFAERKPKENRKISLRIDLENSIKAQQSAGYEKWAKLHNLKQAARTLNFLTEHEIDSYPDLESRVAEITAASTEAAAALKAAERRLAEMAVLIKDVTTCKELRPLLQEYQRAADKKQFRRKHEGTLILYEAAAKALKEQGFQKLPDLYALKNEYKQLAEQKDQMQRQYNDAKRQMQEYGIIKQNVDGILRTTPGTCVIPLAEEVFPGICVPRLKILVTGHFPHRFQHGPPALFLDGLFHHRFKQRPHILRVKEGYFKVGRQTEHRLQAPACLPFHALCPQGQRVGQAPHREIARVMLFPAAEAEVGKGQRSGGVHDLL